MDERHGPTESGERHGPAESGERHDPNESSGRSAGSGERLAAPATLASVAERAGVSRQTVSNALNNPEMLRPETLARVQAAVAELGYSPNRAARSLRTRASHLIGLRHSPVFEGTANQLMDRFVHSLVRASADVGYHVLLFADEDTEPLAAYADLLRSTAVDAFVVTDTYLGAPQAAWLTSQRAHFVAFGRPWGDAEAAHAWVDVDGAAGTSAATEHLVDRGHRRIAWLGWHEDSLIGEERRSGWQQVATDHRLPTEGLALRLSDSVEAGRAASAALLDSGEPPSGFVCASDTLAIGVLHTLAMRGLRPGPELGVVGFDDSQVAQTYLGGLSSVRQPLEQVAVEVVRGLQGLLTEPATARPGVLLPPALVVRGSS